MDLSIIIVSFNTKDLLDRCLSSIEKSMAGSNLRWEVLVVDNGSTDGSRELLKKKYTRVITLFNKDNVGFGKANNQGMKKAKGEFILLLNSDTEAIDDALPKLYAFAK